jgi:hypothetical protein
VIARHVMERERLAAKVRLLAGNAYKRGAARQALRDAGLEVPTERGSWDSYDDYIFSTFKPRVERHLSVLPGGGEDTRLGAAAGGRSGQLRHGNQPPVVVGDTAAGASPIFDTEED